MVSPLNFATNKAATAGLLRQREITSPLAEVMISGRPRQTGDCAAAIISSAVAARSSSVIGKPPSQVRHGGSRHEQDQERKDEAQPEERRLMIP